MALLLSVVFPVWAQDTLKIEAPQVTGTRAFDLHLSSVTCTPQATILQLNVYGQAGDAQQIAPTCYLQGQTTGRKYRLLRAEGLVPGKKKAIPEKGVLPFTLYFEPLDAADDCFDLLDNEKGSGYNMRGVMLHPSQPTGKIHCHIEGTLLGAKQTTLLFLQEYGTDSRIHTPIAIPAEDGHFAYDLYTDSEKAYELVDWTTLLGGGLSFTFFAEEDTVRISCDLDNFERTQLAGGPLNRDFGHFYYYRSDYLHWLESHRDTMLAEGRYFSPEVVKLRQALQEARNDSARYALMEQMQTLQQEGRALTPEGQDMEARYSRFVKEIDSAQVAFAYRDSSLPAYFFFLKELSSAARAETPLPDTLLQRADFFAARYPAHLYTRTARRAIAAATMNRPGSRTLDFTAEELDGTARRFSDLRKDKIIFLDLWASWCAPCRKHSKEMIPVYEAYKDKGFAVVAVAREQGNTQNMQAAMEKDGYPWPSLVDLDDRHAVWERLGAGNSGGKTWLIDRDGTILLVNPTAEEVRTLLSERLD